jgi:hypothetical protein
MGHCEACEPFFQERLSEFSVALMVAETAMHEHKGQATPPLIVENHGAIW